MNGAIYYEAHAPGVVDYESVLRHFKDQACGRGRIRLIKSKDKTESGQRKNGIILLAANVDKKDSKTDIPPVTVVDPTEADRKRALGLLESQTNSASEAEKKIQNAKSAIEASAEVKHKRPTTLYTGKRKRKSVVKTGYKKPTQKTVKKSVKRRKDIFD
jgi:hypothetical protein